MEAVNRRRSLATACGHVAAVIAALGGTTLAETVTTDVVQHMQAHWLLDGATNATVYRRCNLLRRGLPLTLRARTPETSSVSAQDAALSIMF